VILANDGSLLADFITEAHEHLHQAEIRLLNLETDSENTGTLDGIFRSWHSIKGLSGFLNLYELAEFAHAMESRMDNARRGILKIDSGFIDLLLESNDVLRLLVEAVGRVLDGNEFVLPERFAAVSEKLATLNDGEENYTSAFEATEKKLGEILVESGVVPESVINDALEKQACGDSRKVGQILLEENAVPVRTVAQALAAQKSGRSAAATMDETIRVPVGRIDLLVDSIGEAIIAQSMVNGHRVVAEAQDQELLSKISRAGSILRQIQQLSMSLRMVSVRTTFQKMARVARDLSAKCGKEIDFITEGEDTEFDKSVVENISDPLVHMVRNALDHGIETPQERQAKGKAGKAYVKLSAFHRSGAIFIEVSDNGAGLDREAILRKAVERNLCRSGAELSDTEVYQFIFVPGFSTAGTLTDISGRGVGMDVVKRNIELLRGTITIDSRRGEGTTFTIKLPLTLAVVDGMVVLAGNERYIIPTLSIVESLMVASGDIATVAGKGAMLEVRGEHIPVASLKNLLGQAGGRAADDGDAVVMVVEDMLGRKAGLKLTKIVGQQQVVIKSLGEGMGDVTGVAGGAILNDGSVCLILDIAGIMRLTSNKLAS